MEEKSKKGEYWQFYDYFKGKIAQNSWPIMFYGPNTDDRVEFIKQIARDCPFNEDGSEPYVLYTDDVGIEQKDGMVEKPEDIEYYDFLASDYLKLGILKKFVEDMVAVDPAMAERLINSSRDFVRNFRGFSASGIINKACEDMEAVKESYDSPPADPTQSVLKYINGEVSRAFWIRPQNLIGNFCLRTRKVSYILDVRTKLVPASMHAINELIADRDSTRIILPQEYDWKKCVRPGEKHEITHDYQIEFLTDEAEQMYKRKMYRDRT